MPLRTRASNPHPGILASTVSDYSMETFLSDHDCTSCELAIRKHKFVFGMVAVPLKRWNIVSQLSKASINVANTLRGWHFEARWCGSFCSSHPTTTLPEAGEKITTLFHATWRLRNEIYFGETQAVAPSIPNVQASFRSHYHFLFRHSSDWNIDCEALNRVLTRLGFEPERTELLPNLPRQRIWIPRS
ncbi:hypothetical protein PHMEG_00023414 [Phytophthora megakarya]|uniref:Uncharacterized protein n=1 Tax=Phytophthora megakarya TaxID=4795 RepID=A0A225VI75_9STRA|nr:hypothetical protein PHMEG_00023414 [Phytophthora megakarya]